MRQTLLAAVVLAALIAPASAQSEMDPKLVRLFEIATDPTPFYGTRQEVRCAMYGANLTLAFCAVFNQAGQGVGMFPISTRRLSAEDRTHAVANCAGREPSPACVADITADVVEDYGSASLRELDVTWVDLSQ